nr:MULTISPECIES: alkaline shock response membrane anchor protein AmaP [Pediococcus]
MKKESLLLKIILFLVTLAIIAGWGFGTYGFTIVGFDFNNHYAYVFYNLAVGVFAAGIFLLITSYLCFHLLLAIDKNQFYSSLTSTRLAQISHLFCGYLCCCHSGPARLVRRGGSHGCSWNFVDRYYFCRCSNYVNHSCATVF